MFPTAFRVLRRSQFVPPGMEQQIAAQQAAQAQQQAAQQAPPAQALWAPLVLCLAGVIGRECGNEPRVPFKDHQLDG